MRNIRKPGLGPELAGALARHKRDSNPEFACLTKECKAALKESLLKEQGALCCYCMKRIFVDTMRVEHWRCQERHPALQLEYDNLLAACAGRIGHLPDVQDICDVRKGNKDLKYNPAADDVERLLTYKKDGTIVSSDPEFEEQLHSVLNLNCALLQRNRQAVFDGFVSSVKKWTMAELRRRMETIVATNPEYSGVTLFLLRKKLRKMEAAPGC